MKRSKLGKIIACSLAVISVLVMNPIGASAKWKQSNGNWYYIKQDGTKATGWINDGGNWYYLKQNGTMFNGWLNDNGRWYYLNSSGIMARNTVVDGYKIGADGAWITTTPTGSTTTSNITSNESSDGTKLSQLRYYAENKEYTQKLRDDSTLEDTNGTVYLDGIVYDNMMGGLNKGGYRSYRIDGNYSRTTGKFFILNKEYSTDRRAVLTILGDDDNVLYTSPTIKAGMDPIEFDVDISGVNSITYKIVELKGGHINTYRVFGLGDVTLY